MKNNIHQHQFWWLWQDLGWTVRCCNCYLESIRFVFSFSCEMGWNRTWLKPHTWMAWSLPLVTFYIWRVPPWKWKAGTQGHEGLVQMSFLFKTVVLSGSMSLIFRGVFLNINFQKQTPQYRCVSLQNPGSPNFVQQSRSYMVKWCFARSNIVINNPRAEISYYSRWWF